MSMENQSKEVKTLQPCFECKDRKFKKNDCDESCALYEAWEKEEVNRED